MGLGMAWLCCAMLACSDGQRAHAAALGIDARLPTPPVLQHAGCLRWEGEGGVTCELAEDRRLTFWCSSDEEPLRVSGGGGGGALDLVKAEDLGPGARYELRVPEGVSVLKLGAGAARWTLKLAEPQGDPALTHARALRRRGELVLARATLERVGASLSLRARAESARIALQQADYERAARELAQSLDEAAALGRVSEAIADGTALAFVLSSNLRRFDQARAVLARVQQLAAHDDTGQALLPHYQGVLALETGDLRLALRLFRAAVRATGRLSLREHELLAREQEAWTLSLLGQHAAAIDAQRKLADSVGDAADCQRADRLESVVWYVLLAGGADRALTELARTYSARAEGALEGCASPWRKRNHLVNAGLLSEQRGDLSAVEASLQALSGTPEVDDPVLQAWEWLLRGRAALRSGAPGQALSAFRRALATCRRHGLWEPEQLALLGNARAWLALRGPSAALAAYRAAEEALDRSLFSVPLSEGLGGARHARAAGTYELMELLLRQGDTAGALAVARRARARTLMLHSAQERLAGLSEPDQRQWDALLERYHASRERSSELREGAWQLPRTQAKQREREIAASERVARDTLDEAFALVLADSWRTQARGDEDRAQAARAPHASTELWTHDAAEPAGRATVALFAGPETLHAFAFGCGPLKHHALSLQAQGSAWLAALAPDLACASELRVIVPATLGGLDVASWELHGVPAVERWEIRYALDVPRRHVERAQRGTLRVVDPRADLPRAAQEAELKLPRGFLPVRTWARSAAQRGELLRVLPGLALFHYAGHHRFAGAEGYDSELLLSGASLSVGDVLTLRAAPRFVVLSACDGARLDSPGLSAGIDLAYAFVLSGAHAVVAATRPVSDELGYALSSALYEALPEEPASERELTRALRAAQLRVRRDNPAADWSAFRVITR